MGYYNITDRDYLTELTSYIAGIINRDFPSNKIYLNKKNRSIYLIEYKIGLSMGPESNQKEDEKILEEIAERKGEDLEDWDKLSINTSNVLDKWLYEKGKDRPDPSTPKNEWSHKHLTLWEARKLEEAYHKVQKLLE